MTTIKQGANGDDVKTLQASLRARGYYAPPAAIDGFFGSDTDAFGRNPFGNPGIEISPVLLQRGTLVADGCLPACNLAILVGQPTLLLLPRCRKQRGRQRFRQRNFSPAKCPPTRPSSDVVVQPPPLPPIADTNPPSLDLPPIVFVQPPPAPPIPDANPPASNVPPVVFDATCA